LVGDKLQKHTREPDRFFRKIATALVDACHVVPADSEGSINRFQHRLKPGGQLAPVRNLKPNAAVANLDLGAG